MTVTLGWILAASFVGGTLSAGLAAFSLLLRASWVPILVSFAIGALLGAAFLQSTQVGIIAAVAIVAHEIPQEVGDFLILLHSGYTRARALAMNLLSSLATVVGGLIGYFGLRAVADWEATLLGFLAAGMIYVAVADLIPGLHRRPHLRDTASQALLIALGIGMIAGLRLVLV